MNKILTAAVVTLLFTGCDIKETIYDSAPGGKGTVTLTTDWTNRTQGAEIPTEYTVVLDGAAQTFTEAANTLPAMAAGTYPVWVYNDPDKITISGTTANVATTGSVVDPAPGWLSTSALDVVYEDDKDIPYTAVITQQVRQLTIELTVIAGDPSRIARTEAILSGVAGGMDFGAGTYTGSGVMVEPEFTRMGDKLTATVRLIGITTEAQTLTLTIHYTDVTEPEIIRSEVSDRLSGFNTGKHTPMTLTADLGLPVEAGFTATITDWKQVTGGSGIAN